MEGKTVLITGGTGSFGQAFARHLLDNSNPRAIRIYSRGELLQVTMAKEFDDPRLRFFIGDVRDKDRLSRAMNGVDVVVHAAALKHVPICEYSPLEATKTNIDGTANVIDAAIDNGVERVIGISSDKCVEPINHYGATKLVMEKLLVQGNAYSGDRDTRFSVVRYGNVIGSRGSVIPLFLRCKGPLPITDPRMTRFWITLKAGVEFVASCLDQMQGGEVFVPKIPSMLITDLAEVIAPSRGLVTVGMRPGEKLHEVLITEYEAPRCREFVDRYAIQPEHPFWKASIGGMPVPPDFRYASNTNHWWLRSEDLAEIIRGIK